MRFALLSCLLAVPVVLGAPVALSEADTSALFKTALTITAPSCAVPALNLPAGIVVPAGQSLKLATVGRGMQNYTCTAGAYVSAGAVAELYDVSCILSLAPFFVPLGTDLPSTLPDLALKYLTFPSPLPIIRPAIDHYFIPTPGSITAGAISPGFFSRKDSKKAVLARVGSATAPDPVNDVAWLQLGALPGQDTLAKTVLRVYTAGGQPPSSCSVEGAQFSVEYASLYYFAS